jgi:Holliday junction DNA helicase RuvA
LITRITGRLVALNETAATLAAGAFEYEVLVPEFVRRQLQSLVGQDVSLKTIDYIDGNPQQGKLTPRLIGFLHDAEREFFSTFCQVDGIGVKTALRAMVRPVREVASAIEEQDVKALTTLPGVGAALAERIVAKLRRKMTKFALMVDRSGGAVDATAQPSFAEDAYEALISLGHTAGDAREKVETALENNKKIKTVDELLMEIYRRSR